MNIGSTAGSSFSVATAGVQQGNEDIRKASQQVVEAATERPAQGTIEVTEGLVNLREGQRQTEASVKVLEAADRTVGTLIDTLA